MTTPSSSKRKGPKYGIDRPDLILLSSVGGLLWIALATALNLSGVLPPPLGSIVQVLGTAVGISGLLVAATFVVSTKIMKFRQRDSLLDSIDWRGVQTVLDVGCGPGLLLIGAAKRIAEGKAVGVDIWQRRVESRNRVERALENARLEGVAEKVEVRDGDVRNLPFPDSMFDVLISRAVLHNLKGKEERQRAISEIVRVLKPNGQVALILVDSWHLSEYLDMLRRNNVRIQKVSKPPPYFPPGLLFLASVAGRKSR